MVQRNPLSITDILVKIGKFKHQMERVDDLQKIYGHEIFHDILTFLWLGITDTELTYWSKSLGNDRLRIHRCYFCVHFELLHKFKKKPYYDATIPLTTYSKLAKQMLNCPELVKFLKHFSNDKNSSIKVK